MTHSERLSLPLAGRLAKTTRGWFNRVIHGVALLSRPWLWAAASAAYLLSAPSSHAGAPFGFVLVQAEGITVHDAWARASAGAASTAAAYVTLMGGARSDQLVGVSTPVAATAEVHKSFVESGVMKMRAAPDVPVPAGGTLTFAPGGLHIMLMGLKQPLVAGQSFPLTLIFAQAPALTVDVKVQPLGRSASSSDPGSAPAR